MTIGLHIFINETIRTSVEHPEYRRGQTYVNVVREIRPDLYTRIPPEKDCFYTDTLCPDFLGWLLTEW